jgi:hypothetical protein
VVIGFSPSAPVPLGLSGDSSIAPAAAPAKGIWAAIARPFSSAPEVPYLHELVKIQDKISKTLEKEGNQLGREIKSDLKRLEAFNAEKMELLHTHAEALQSQASWSAWLAVTEYMGYAGSIALGAACFASGAGTAPTLFFVASGFIGLLNRIGSDAGAWRWAVSFITESREKQIVYEQAFTTAMTTAAVALSIAAAWNAYHLCLNEKLLSEAAGRVTFLFDMAVGAGQTALKLGESYHVKTSMKINNFLKLSAEKTLNLQTEIAMDTAAIQKQFTLSKELDKVIKSAIAVQQQWP